jgi:hypothetical protein
VDEPARDAGASALAATLTAVDTPASRAAITNAGIHLDLIVSP